MNTRKFEVEFDHARILSSEIELSAKVITDVAYHYVRMRMGRPTQELWIDHGRVYTPAQEAHVKQLFSYQEPLVRESFNRWLKAHNFPTLDKLEATMDSVGTLGHDISAYQAADGQVTSFRWEDRS